MLKFLQREDEEIAQLIRDEKRRQEETVSLIASENIAPVAIMEASGSVFTNKSVEGYPGARYHGGIEYVDAAEELAITRCKELFEAEYVNVQPHCGTNANVAVYLVALKPGDTVLAMRLADGGHLSHGNPANLSGQIYRFMHYGVDKNTELIDYDEVEWLAKEHRPKMLVAGSSAYSRLIDWERLRAIADKVSAYFLVDMAHIVGLVAARIIPSPVPYAHFVSSSIYKTIPGPRGGFIMAQKEFGPDLNKAVFPGCQSSIIVANMVAKAVAFKKAMTPEFQELAQQIVKNAQALAQNLQSEGFRIISGGTDNHLMLVDLRNKEIKGDEAERVLDEVGISTNKNMVPFDPEKPAVTSGLRLGSTPATSRGMKEEEMSFIARIMSQALNHRGDDQVKAKLRQQVLGLCRQFPIPGYDSLYASND
ncbi:MAG: serine hydroxymethyltransferase [Desulfatiglandales bacterium]